MAPVKKSLFRITRIRTANPRHIRLAHHWRRIFQQRAVIAVGVVLALGGVAAQTFMYSGSVASEQLRSASLFGEPLVPCYYNATEHKERQQPCEAAYKAALARGADATFAKKYADAVAEGAYTGAIAAYPGMPQTESELRAAQLAASRNVGPQAGAASPAPGSVTTNAVNVASTTTTEKNTASASESADERDKKIVIIKLAICLQKGKDISACQAEVDGNTSAPLPKTTATRSAREAEDASMAAYTQTQVAQHAAAPLVTPAAAPAKNLFTGEVVSTGNEASGGNDVDNAIRQTACDAYELRLSQHPSYYKAKQSYNGQATSWPVAEREKCLADEATYQKAQSGFPEIRTQAFYDKCQAGKMPIADCSVYQSTSAGIDIPLPTYDK